MKDKVFFNVLSILCVVLGVCMFLAGIILSIDNKVTGIYLDGLLFIIIGIGCIYVNKAVHKE